MTNFTPKRFTGLLIPEVPVKPTDYIHKKDSPLHGLGYRVENSTSEWKDFKPTFQAQSTSIFETDNCTGFGYCRVVATYLNFKLKNNQLPQTFITWATKNNYIQNGSFLFDPRALGIMAGTSENGNWLQTVADTARLNGLLPGNTLPGPESIAAGGYAAYYNKDLITPELKALALEFLSYVSLPYQWLIVDDIESDVTEALKACPLYTALCTCGGWNKPPVQWCNAGDNSNHCVGELDASPQIILDSYLPDLKQLSGDYNIPFRMMVLVTVKGNFMVVYFQVKGQKTIWRLIDGEWYGFSTPAKFQADVDGRPYSVLQLEAAEFAKLKINPDIF